MTQPLFVSMRLSKHELTLGDRLTITATIQNSGSSVFHFLARPKPYETHHVKVFSGDDSRLLESYWLSALELAPFSRRDFVELQPGDQISMAFDAELHEETIRDVRKRSRPGVKGTFLVFSDSAILIPEKGRYAIRFQVETGEFDSQEAREKFGIRDVWTGKVVSDPVEIVVR